MNLQQKGVTLIEMILVIGLMTVISILSLVDKQTDFEHARARQIGSYIYQYNNAVRSALAQGLVPATTTNLGTNWLKNSSCGGVLAVGAELLPCSFPVASAADPIQFGKMSFSTAIVVSGTAPNKKYVATTVTPPFSLDGGTAIRADLAGIATVSAAAALATGIQSGSGGLALFTATTDASFKSDPLTGRITFVASNNANNDVWMRSDGGNKMHAALNFDGPNSVDRAIVGASSIQNFAGQALFLGAGSGMTAMSAATVVMDGNAEVLGSFRVRNNIQVDGGMTMSGSLNMSGNLGVSGAIWAGSTISTPAGMIASGNINAGGAFVGQYLSDSNDGSYYVDPNGASQMNSVYANIFVDRNDANYYVDPNGSSRLNATLANTSYASIFYDLNNTGYYLQPSQTSRLNSVVANVSYASIFYDLNNTGYYLQPAQTSRMNSIQANSIFSGVYYDINNSGYYTQPASTSRMNTIASDQIINYGRMTANEFIQVNGIANDGWGCAPNGLIGRSPAGAVMSCQNGIWKAGSASLGATWQQINGDQQGWIPLECPAGYVMTGITAPNEDWKSIRCRQLQ